MNRFYYRKNLSVNNLHVAKHRGSVVRKRKKEYLQTVQQRVRLPGTPKVSADFQRKKIYHRQVGEGEGRVVSRRGDTGLLWWLWKSSLLPRDDRQHETRASWDHSEVDARPYSLQPVHRQTNCCETPKADCLGESILVETFSESHCDLETGEKDKIMGIWEEQESLTPGSGCNLLWRSKNPQHN